VRAICDLAYGVCRALGVLLAIGMTSVVTINIVSRYFFDYSFSWSEEAARYMMVWMTMIGAAMAVRKWSHFRLEFLEHVVGWRVRSVLHSIALFATLVVGCLLTWQGLVWLPITNHELATALQVPMSWFYCAVPFGGVLVTLFAIDSLVDEWTKPSAVPDRQASSPI
jgi:TRAP-type C4-dicarboxylate transport system permease small subunit